MEEKLIFTIEEKKEFMQLAASLKKAVDGTLMPNDEKNL